MKKRRFAITASDRYIGVFKAFVEQGWEPVKLFTAPMNDHMSDNKLVINMAGSCGIPIQMSRMKDADLAELASQDCELLVVASYQWRIGDWQRFLPRAINFHPAPLPDFRGPFPLVQGIREGRSQWGTTCHKVAHDFDTGDILAARSFAMSPHECLDALDLKIQIESRILAFTVAQNLDALWAGATPQGVGRYVGFWKDCDRELNFQCSVSEIDAQLRAFGSIECLASFNNLKYFVRRAVCWAVAHSIEPGSLVHSDGIRHVLACSGGFVALLDWSLVGPCIRIDSSVR